jgi:hypothetical protein
MVRLRDLVVKLILAFWLVNCGIAEAGINNPGSASSGSIGSAQINAGSDLLPANFISIIPTGSMSFSGGATPGTAALDTNGYPTQGFTGTVDITFPGTIWNGVNYMLSWTAGTKLSITNLGTNSNCSLSGTGGSVSGCSGVNVTLTIDGTGAGSLTWNPGGSFSLQFPGSGSYGAAGTASIKLSRASDVGLTGYITPEYKAAETGINPKSWRTMGMDAINSGIGGNWTYRSTPTSLSWGAQYPLGTWSGGTNSAGTITGTDQYTAPAAPNTSLTGWVANEVLQGVISNAQNPLITVSGIANNGSGLCRLTVSSTSTLTTNQQVWVADVELSTKEINFACSNALFLITVIDATHIDLQGTMFAGTYNANTGAVGTQTLTITGKSGGAKFIESFDGFPPGYAYAPSVQTGIGTFVYDALLDRVVYNPGGYSSSVPIEVEASIANEINANLWANIPAFADDTYVTNWAAAACANLNSALYFMPEYDNEVWNDRFPSTKWARAVGISFGFPGVANSEAVFGWYGLRVRQIMGNLIPAVCNGHKLRRTLMFQVTGDPSATQTYRFNGADLAPSGTSTGKGNAAYSNYTGSANYTVSPNRPIDVVETIGYAPYASGTNFSDQGSNGGTVASAANAAFLQTLATAFNSNPNDPTSLAALDNDQRQGTILTQSFTCPTGTTVTLNGHGFSNTSPGSNAPSGYIVFTASGGTVCNGLSLNTAYCLINATTNTFQVSLPVVISSVASCSATPISLSPGTGTSSVGSMNRSTILSLSAGLAAQWEAVAASYDGGPVSPKRVEAYEGAIQPVTPSVATLTSLGVTVSSSSTTANTALQAGLIAWKNSSLAAATQIYYFTGFETGYAHSKTPSQLVLPCGGQYGLLSTCFPNSTPYQLYNGFAGFHGVVNFLLKRDLDPASNDNTPMWLDKAA